MPVPYFHVVYTLPSKLRDIAYQNKRVVYDLLMKAAAETTLAIAADPRRLGARIGITAVLHTWGSTLTHHPHVHMIVPGGGLSLDGSRWVASRSNFLVHVNLLARLFSGKMLAMLADAHDAGQLTFFNAHAGLADKTAFKRFIAPLRRIKWVVYCKAPFAGPKQVLRYLSRYTHRVAISNRRLIAADDAGVAFRWKDYRIDGPGRWKTMRLHPHEFIRRFLLHVLPRGFHRIRHYGLFANANRADNIATARALLGVDPPAADPQQQSDIAPDAPRALPCPCPRCGARMIVIEVFARGCEPRWRPTPTASSTRHEPHVLRTPPSAFRLRSLHAGDDLSRPNSWQSMRPAPAHTLQEPAETLFSLSRPLPRAGVQVASLQGSAPIEPALASNRHSARRPTGRQPSRDFVPRRFLDAGWLCMRKVSVLPASKNLYNSGRPWRKDAAMV